MSKTYRELTGKEKRQIKKLVVSKCANYDKEYGCLPLSGTPKSRKTFWGEEEQRSERAFRACTETSDTELATTSNCYMLGICYTNSALCRYFRESVLPEAPKLDAVFNHAPTVNCKLCGKPFLIDGKRVYCSKRCATEARRQQTAARVRKHREKQNQTTM